MDEVMDIFIDALSGKSGMVIMVLFAIGIIGLLKIFRKAGKTPILAIIPIVNFFVLTDIVFGKPVKALWMLVPIVNILFLVRLLIGLAKSFGYPAIVGILMIFFGPIISAVIGLGNHEYQKQFGTDNCTAE